MRIMTDGETCVMPGQRVFVLEYKWTTKPLAAKTEPPPPPPQPPSLLNMKDSLHFIPHTGVTFIEYLKILYRMKFPIIYSVIFGW